MTGTDYTALLAIETKCSILQLLTRPEMLLVSATSHEWRTAAMLDERYYLHTGARAIRQGTKTVKPPSLQTQIVDHSLMYGLPLALTQDSTDADAWPLPADPGIHGRWLGFSKYVVTFKDRVVRLRLSVGRVMTQGGLWVGSMPALRELELKTAEPVGYGRVRRIVVEEELQQLIAPVLDSVSLTNFTFTYTVPAFRTVTRLSASFGSYVNPPDNTLALGAVFPQLLHLRLKLVSQWPARPLRIEWTGLANRLLSLDTRGWVDIPKEVISGIPNARLSWEANASGQWPLELLLSDVLSDPIRGSSTGDVAIVLFIEDDRSIFVVQPIRSETQLIPAVTRVILDMRASMFISDPLAGPHPSLAPHITTLTVPLGIFEACSWSDRAPLPSLRLLKLLVLQDVRYFGNEVDMPDCADGVDCADTEHQHPQHPHPEALFPKLQTLELQSVQRPRAMRARALVSLLREMGVFRRVAPSVTDLALDLKGIALADRQAHEALWKRFTSLNTDIRSVFDPKATDVWVGDDWLDGRIG